MKIEPYYNDTYGFNTYVCFGEPSEALKALLMKEPFKWNEERYKDCFGEASCWAGLTIMDCCTDDNYDNILIWVRNIEPVTANVATLSHECGHVAHEILKRRGWDDFENDTVFHSYLYLHDTIFKAIGEKVFDAYYAEQDKSKKNNKKKKKKGSK